MYPHHAFRKSPDLVETFSASKWKQYMTKISLASVLSVIALLVVPMAASAQDVLTNNLANAQTVGFKRDLVNMRARANAVNEDVKMAQYRLPVSQDQGGGVLALGLARAGHVADSAADGRLGHGNRLLRQTGVRQEGLRDAGWAGSGAAGVACTGPGSRPPFA